MSKELYRGGKWGGKGGGNVAGSFGGFPLGVAGPSRDSTTHFAPLQGVQPIPNNVVGRLNSGEFSYEVTLTICLLFCNIYTQNTTRLCRGFRGEGRCLLRGVR
jgi:hypothetical protein